MKANNVARWGTHRLAWEPLAAQLNRDAGEPLADKEAGRRLGLHRRQINRWRKSGLPVQSADRIACRLGLHPFEVWGDEFWADLQEATPCRA